MNEIAEETFGPLDEYPDSNPKTRVGAKKPTTFSIPPSAILHLGGAMENGRRKYGLMNWRENRVSSSVYADAMDRHLLAWRDGENNAADSGCHHLAHVMACAAILIDAMECGNLNDDRSAPGPASRIIDAALGDAE